MKKWICGVFVVLSFWTCKNDAPEIADPANAPDISAVPARFDQKMLLEEFTSSLCGQCPKSHLLRDSLRTQYANRFYSVAMHSADFMIDSSITSFITGKNFVDSLFNPSGIYPSGIINRQVSSSADLIPDFWGQKLNALYGAVPRCGLAIDAKTITGTRLNLTVHTGFSADMFGDYRVHVYLVQDLIQTNDSLYSQLNDFSIEGLTPDSTSSLYLLNDTIRNYKHKYVLKRILSDNGLAGDIIPQTLMTRGNDFAKTYVINLTGINYSACSIVAFVDKYGDTDTNHRIENVQMVKVGEAKDWN